MGRRTGPAICILSTALLLNLSACERSSPTGPAAGSLEGRWTGALADRAPCVGDWTSFVLTLDSSGIGELVTRDGARFQVSEVTENGIRRLEVPLPPGPGECQSISFVVDALEVDGTGVITAFSGQAQGRCCGTIRTPYRLTRS